MALGVSLVGRLHIAIIVVVRGRLCRCLATSLSILLGNSALQLIDRTFLKLFAHHFLFSEPGILRLTRFVNIRCVILSVRRLRMPL